MKFVANNTKIMGILIPSASSTSLSKKLSAYGDCCRSFALGIHLQLNLLFAQRRKPGERLFMGLLASSFIASSALQAQSKSIKG
jgi:hypothetical protein